MPFARPFPIFTSEWPENKPALVTMHYIPVLHSDLPDIFKDLKSNPLFLVVQLERTRRVVDRVLALLVTL